ncbi:MAG: hypothetical protein ABFC96_18065 [Thermoguttaceae bacterium]
MDARTHWAVISTPVQRTPLAVRRAAFLAALLLVSQWASQVSMGASQRSANFIVETADPVFAQQVSKAAEQYRRDLAIAWLGKPMPNWSRPCAMTVQAAPNLGAGGKTTFMFENGEVFGWQMTIQGSQERVLDSVLPHEITHMIFASHFRQPLPRWADEGGATTVEHYTEKNKYRQMLFRYLHTGYGIAFNRMFAMMDYPQNIDETMALYSQGYSVVEYLILLGGRQEYVRFLDDGLKTNDWVGAVQRHYARKDLGTLQNVWLAWVKEGAPLDKRPEGAVVAASAVVPVNTANERRPRPEPNLIYHVSDPQPAPPLKTSAVVPVRFPAASAATPPAAAAATPSVAATSVSRSEPQPLPAAGWRMAGATAHVSTGPDSAYPRPID